MHITLRFIALLFAFTFFGFSTQCFCAEEAPSIKTITTIRKTLQDQPLPTITDPSYPIEYNRYFKNLTHKDTPLHTEQNKILLLIDLLRNSAYQFERNGKVHTSVEAAQHLMSKYAYMRTKIKTANEFIDLLASKSSASGHDYHVIVKDTEIYPAGIILHNELDRMNHLLKMRPAAK